MPDGFGTYPGPVHTWQASCDGLHHTTNCTPETATQEAEARCTACGRLAGVPTAPCPACPDTLPPPTGTSEALQQALQLPPPGPDGKWRVQLHTGTSAAEALQLYAATEPLFDCGYPHGDPGPAAHQAAAAITGHQHLEADLEAAARDRHDRTHTTAGPTPGCPWCAMAQAGDDDA